MKPALKWLIPTFGMLLLTVLISFYVSTTTKKLGQSNRTFSDLGGNFTLTSKNGTISLNDYKDEVVVLYFGYLSCADVCPTSMSVISNAFNKLTNTQIKQTQGIFISVDPDRDNTTDIEKFTRYFHKKIIGVTGSKTQIAEVSEQYGVYYNTDKLENSLMDYSVDHASRFYIINKKGKLITAMSHSTTPNELAAQIMELL
ncbi:hypothetical protein CJF42_17545 [Pseudoalteromonas sp. NBT06-2]|uniref:SCO family protein n=1 Tax=Pseudoalteromonas sp. NBT06-2 TaxID=2025950 RepID=UPI000BA7C35D|nr:SCO family protein [Pseudoalteromonas sp. NBT06-2]PAJ73107.1 hypothetical protein CJF42_17545 [Pseudoalteromonas sp. NBT06-2]